MDMGLPNTEFRYFQDMENEVSLVRVYSNEGAKTAKPRKKKVSFPYAEVLSCTCDIENISYCSKVHCTGDGFVQRLARLHNFQKITVHEEQKRRGEKPGNKSLKGKPKKAARRLLVDDQSNAWQLWKENIASNVTVRNVDNKNNKDNFSESQEAKKCKTENFWTKDTNVNEKCWQPILDDEDRSTDLDHPPFGDMNKDSALGVTFPMRSGQNPKLGNGFPNHDVKFPPVCFPGRINFTKKNISTFISSGTTKKESKSCPDKPSVVSLKEISFDGEDKLSKYRLPRFLDSTKTCSSPRPGPTRSEWNVNCNPRKNSTPYFNGNARSEQYSVSVNLSVENSSRLEKNIVARNCIEKGKMDYDDYKDRLSNLMKSLTESKARNRQDGGCTVDYIKRSRQLAVPPSQCIPPVSYGRLIDGSDKLMCLSAAACVNKVTLSADKRFRSSKTDDQEKPSVTRIVVKLPTIRDIMTQTDKFFEV